MLTYGQDLLPASVVSQCREGRIVKPDGKNLLLVKGNIIEIYTVHEKVFECVIEITLTLVKAVSLYKVQSFSATIRAAEVLRRPQNEVDQLILRFDGMKVSMVQFSEKLGDFLTVSLHDWSNEQLLLGLPEYAPSSVAPIGDGIRQIAVSGDGRCAIIRLNAGNWAIMTFSSGEDDLQDVGPSSSSSRVLGGKFIDERIGHVLDFAFLDGFFEPTFALIYESSETGPNWPGQLAVRKDTVEILFVTLNLGTGQFTPIFHRSGLPSEGRRLLAVPKPIGGVLLLGSNMFMHIDLAGSSTVCPLNNFGHLGSPGQVQPTTLELTFGGCIAVMRDRCSALWCTTEGAWHWLKLAPRALTIEPFRGPAFKLCCPSAYLPLGDDLLFAASLTGPHQLIRMNMPSMASLMMSDDLYGDEDDLYGTGSQPTSPSSSNTIDLVQELPSVGPISDFTLAPTDTKHEIIVAGGVGTRGHVTSVSRTIPLSTQLSFTHAGAQRTFPLLPDFLLISSETSSLLLRVRNDQMTEVESSAFTLELPTLYACSLPDGRLLQVLPSGYRLVSSDGVMLLGEQDLTDIVSARVAGNSLILLVKSGILIRVSLETQEVQDLDSDVKQFSCMAHNQQVLLGILHHDASFILMGPSGEIFKTTYLSYLPQVMLSGSVLHEPTSVNVEISVGLYSSGVEVFLSVCDGQLVVFYKYLPEINALVKVSATLASVMQAGNYFEASWGRGYLHGNAMLIVDHLGYPRVHHLREPVMDLIHIRERMFVGVLGDGSVSILKLDDSLVLASNIPFTPHYFNDCAVSRIVYNRNGSCFGLLVSRPADKPYAFPDDDYSMIADNKEWKPPATLPDGFVLPGLKATQYSFCLMSIDYHVQAGEIHSLEPDEYVVACEMMTLNTKETTTGKKSFMVLGAVQVNGEDRPVRSRVLIFDVLQLVPEPGQPATMKLKLLMSHPLKTTISAICQINGYVAITSGYKTILYEFEDNETLTGVAFIDAGVHIAASCALKSFLWLGDCGGRRGVGLYAFQERPPKLVELSRLVEYDEEQHSVHHVNCMISEGGQVEALAVDGEGRAAFLAYSPTTLSSRGGTRLVCVGAVKLGSPIVGTRQFLLGDGSVGILWAGIDGRLGFLAPIPQGYDDLREAQLRMTNNLPHPAGLHPRGSKSSSSPNRNFIDGLLVLDRFIGLPRLVQAKLGAGLAGGVLPDLIAQVYSHLC